MKTLNGYEIVDEAARNRLSLLEETGGRSAYDIAVENGFEGSEEEWLESLHGKDGDDGYTPVKGVDYFDGEDGYTPVKGVDYFDGKDGYTPQKGVDYFDGQDGEDGYTPIKGVDYFDGEPGKDGVAWIDLGMVDDVMAEMDNLLEDGHYKLWTDDPFCYFVTVERAGDYVGQTHWTTEEGRGATYFRSAYFNGDEWEWIDEWTPHVTQDWLNQYALKTHKHRQSMNADFDTWIQTFREGQYHIHVQAETKSYVVDQYVFNNKPVSTIHVCQLYFEVSEPWKVYARHGTTNGNYVLVNWDEWQTIDYGDALTKKLDGYIVTGTWGEEDGEYFATIDDDFDWDDMLAAINENHYVGCILHHVDGSGVSLRLALASTWPEDGYIVFTALDEGVRAYDLYLNSGANASLVWRQLATMEDVENASGGAELTRESIESALGYTPADADEVAMYTHNHSASAITSGTLNSARLPTVPITKGGTGATTAAAARTSLGITPANIGAALAPIVSTTDITAGSTASDGRPYHVIE